MSGIAPMTMVAFASVKASPGVTTAALAVAAGWPQPVRAVVAECDPAGGDVAAWFDLPATPGLVSLAAAARRDPAAGRLADHCQRLPGGVEVLAGPPGAAQAIAALQVLAGQRAGALTTPTDRAPAVVVADCGRLTPGSPAGTLLGVARLTVLVVRPVLAEVSHVAAAVDAVREVTRSLVLVVVGDDGYTSDDLAAALEVPVMGRLPHDPAGAGLTAGRVAVSRRLLRRSRLARAARVLAADLAHRLTGDVPALTAGPEPAATVAGTSATHDQTATGPEKARPAPSERRHRRLVRDAAPPAAPADRRPVPGWIPSVEADG